MQQEMQIIGKVFKTKSTPILKKKKKRKKGLSLIKKKKTDTWPRNEVSLPAIWAQLTGDVYEKYSVLNDHE